MKYVLIDQIKNGDCFTNEFGTKEEAIKGGELAFQCMSEFDKNRREEFLVLEAANPDEDAENHLDGDIVKRWK